MRYDKNPTSSVGTERESLHTDDDGVSGTAICSAGWRGHAVVLPCQYGLRIRQITYRRHRFCFPRTFTQARPSASHVWADTRRPIFKSNQIFTAPRGPYYPGVFPGSPQSCLHGGSLAASRAQILNAATEVIPTRRTRAMMPVLCVTSGYQAAPLQVDSGISPPGFDSGAVATRSAPCIPPGSACRIRSRPATEAARLAQSRTKRRWYSCGVTIGIRGNRVRALQSMTWIIFHYVLRKPGGCVPPPIPIVFRVTHWRRASLRISRGPPPLSISCQGCVSPRKGPDIDSDSARFAKSLSMRADRRPGLPAARWNTLIREGSTMNRRASALRRDSPCCYPQHTVVPAAAADLTA